MTKKSRNRRKAIRIYLRSGLITATLYADGRLFKPFNMDKVKKMSPYVLYVTNHES